MGIKLSDHPHLDLRTKAGRRAEIIKQVNEHGGFSVFWVTANQVRAGVATDMLKNGDLIKTGKCVFPWRALKVTTNGH